MAREAATRTRSTESRLIFTILGVTVWVATGFLVGLVAGVVSEEPQLLVGDLINQGTEIDWTGSERAGANLPSGETVDVAAAPKPRRPLTATTEPAKSIFTQTRDAKPVLTARSDDAPVSARRPQKKDPARERRTARPAPKGPGYLIQVGAYSNRDAAQKVAETLRGKGYAVEVLTAGDDGRFRVRVGPVAARDRAEGLAKRLEDDEGFPTWILPVQES